MTSRRGRNAEGSLSIRENIFKEWIMAVTSFAAIDIGSYNVTMEIFEITKKNGLKSLTTVRQRLELGRDTYNDGMVSPEILRELTRILKDYSRIMKEYDTRSYRACAKTALREARNFLLVREHVRNKTGINIEILSNSEQRFMAYKSIASRGEEFQKFIGKGTAIIDVSGGSIQISLFDKETLVTAQNLKLGLLRISSRLSKILNETTHPDALIDEFIRKDIMNFKRMHLKDRNIDTIILVIVKQCVQPHTVDRINNRFPTICYFSGQCGFLYELGPIQLQKAALCQCAASGFRFRLCQAVILHRIIRSCDIFRSGTHVSV